VAPKLNVTLSQHTSPTSSSPMLGERYSNVATTSNQPSILPSDVYRKLCSRVKRQEIQSSSVAGRVTNCGDWRFGAGNETFNWLDFSAKRQRLTLVRNSSKNGFENSPFTLLTSSRVLGEQCIWSVAWTGNWQLTSWLSLHRCRHYRFVGNTRFLCWRV